MKNIRSYIKIMRHIVGFMFLLILPQFGFTIGGSWMVCSGGQAWLIVANDDGSMHSVTTAGGCAGDFWLIQISVAPSGTSAGCYPIPCNSDLTQTIANNWNLVSISEVFSESEIQEIEHAIKNANSIQYLNPYYLTENQIDIIR